MTERFVCIHGHFYQPPRENACLGTVEIQDSAYPYHDWNERITAECYAPNTAARILDGEGKIIGIVNNYARMSFNVGPTLMSWMEEKTPETYRDILEADKQSLVSQGGHGNAIAQVYNHMIMPLANKRDKKTQILWGIKDFNRRFGRFPEGLWLSETAVDLETLDIAAHAGIWFVILAPFQALRVRDRKRRKWKDVRGGKIDPTRSYLCKLPSGRSINIFFYDGPISRAVAFDKLLNKGEDFAKRLLEGFSDKRGWNQILNIATDGETYGHHFGFGDMALAYALHYIESNGLAKLTNYGAYLERNKPTHEVEIIENTSWSCFHGIERWRADCGCSSGGNPGWNQQWRKPLREALDWLRDRLAEQYEREASRYFDDPWEARNGYIDAVLDNSLEARESFFGTYGRGALKKTDEIILLKLLEIQRQSMLMYTSCGWFFDDISGIETVQILQYAGMALQISEGLSGDSLEQGFLERIEKAKSNIDEHRDGQRIYEKFVKPAMVDLKKVAAHYAISSLFKEYGETADVYKFIVKREDYHLLRGGSAELALGKISVCSRTTGDNEAISFSVLSFGGRALEGGIRGFLGDEAYNAMKNETIETFQAGAFTEVIRLMDKHFGMHNYSLNDLFRDTQRRILRLITTGAQEKFTALFRDTYELNKSLIFFLKEVNMPVPVWFLSVAAAFLNREIILAFCEDKISHEKIRAIIHDMKALGVAVETVDVEFNVRRCLEDTIRRLTADPSMHSYLLGELKELIELLRTIPLDVNYWQIQNIYYAMLIGVYTDYRSRANLGEDGARLWVERFEELGKTLYFNMDCFRPCSEDNLYA